MKEPERKIYSVSRLNQEVQSLLEASFGTLWLEGELSNFSRPASGHFYFTLKDSQSQIRCAMFKGRNRYIDFKPQSGDAVLVRGKLGLYSARGDFQLIVEHMEPAGAGRLQAEFEKIKRQLAADGWFDVAQKRSLPAMPQTIGLITSPTGAAIRDVLQVLHRRYRQANVIVYPTLTQGAAAAPAICQALDAANRRAESDVLLLVRGGGSIEDLWAFNDIRVASAIRHSAIPVVAGIGHEVDITISDLVSDLRAPTPSAAAELATPDTSTLEQRLSTASRQLVRTHKAILQTRRFTLQQQTARLHLRHPEIQLREKTQRLDELQSTLARVWLSRVTQLNKHLSAVAGNLAAQSPERKLQGHRMTMQALHQRLSVSMQHKHGTARSRFELLARSLHNVSPLAVLDRGYALMKNDESLLKSVADTKPGDKLTARLTDGEIIAQVESIRQLP
ncbi:MAG: exodeoxyribonuclease VII large subunit [Granulosicoccus sp.]